MRRVASNIVIIGTTVLHQAVVELYDGRVVNYYEFRDELPMTEWLGGTINIARDADGILRASHNGTTLE